MQKTRLALAGALLLAASAAAQNFTTLVSFDGTNGSETTTSSSTYIQGPMALSTNGNFYGTAPLGGAHGSGVIFMMTPAGVLSVLHDFNAGTDGGIPNGLAQGNDGNFYGATETGGTNAQGTLFKVAPDGTFSVIYSFNAGGGSLTGEAPDAPPVQGSNSNLYGTVSYGAGSHSYSGIYRATTAGGYALIHVLDASTEGYGPESPLIQGTDGDFYGTCSTDGPNGNGTVFKTDSSGNVTVLHAFTAYSSPTINGDGATPYGPLAEGSDGNYYGTTSSGGGFGYGTIFRVASNGGVVVLHTLNQADGGSPNGLTLGKDGSLYGSTGGGGLSAAFKIGLDGTFTAFGSQLTGSRSDGEDSDAPLMQGPSGDFYGTTYGGGIYGMGTIFQLFATNATTPPGGTAGDKAALEIEVNGDGAVNPNDNGRLLTVGSKYTVTAQPLNGWVFSNWIAGGSQSFVSNKAALKFTMSSNLVLQANFATNPFIPCAGIYEGLFMNPAAVTLGSCGSFKATVGNKGSFSANLVLAGRSHSYAGQFAADGTAWNVVNITMGDPMTVSLLLDLAGNNVITGIVSNSAWSADLAAYRTKLYTLPETQKYTLVISGNANSAAQPGGDGFGLLTVNTMGNATFSGVLADNTAVTATAFVSQGGAWPLYASLFSGRGMIIGWLNLTSDAGSDLNGSLTWIEGPHNGVKYYGDGFTNQPQVQGSLFGYTNFSPILNLSDTIFYVSGGSLSNLFTSEVTLVENELLSTNPGLNLNISPATGRFQGVIANPIVGGLPGRIAFKGTVLQKQNVGLGFYLGENQTGNAGIGSNFVGAGFGSLQTYTLALGTAGTGSGSISANPSGPTYPAGTAATVTAAASAGSVFAGWLGDAGGTRSSVQVVMNTNEAVTAVFDLLSTNTNSPTYSLTIGIAGSGTGTVTASPPGPTYTNGAVVKLTEVPDADSSFTGWADDAGGTAPSVQVTMTTNEIVTAVFDLLSTNNSYSLTVMTAGAGNGTVDLDPPGPTYTNGSVVTLTAVPDSISTFTDWSGDASGTAASVQITITTNELVTATFGAIPTFLLTIETSGPGSGTVTASPPGPNYTNGTVVTLTETPQSDSTFSGWSGAASGTATSVQLTMTTNETVVATFGTIPTFTLSISIAGTGSGTVTAKPPGPNYTNGTVVTLTEKPATGSTFAGWSGDASGTGATVKVIMTGNKSVTATFNNPNLFTGTWRGSFTFPIDDVGDMAGYNVVWVMTQSGKKASGTYGEIEWGNPPSDQVNGTLGDGVINGTSFQIWEDEDGLEFIGTLSGNTISGSVVTGSSPGTFSVTRQ